MRARTNTQLAVTVASRTLHLYNRKHIEIETENKLTL